MDKFVCRTCLYVNQNMISFKVVEKVKNILESFVPEIKPNLSDETIICTQCYYFLKNIENFKQKCIENQKRLLNSNYLAHTQYSTNYPKTQQLPQNQLSLFRHANYAGNVGESETSFYLLPQASSTIISSEKCKRTSENVIKNPKNAYSDVFENDQGLYTEKNYNDVTIYKKARHYSWELEDVIEISDNEVELDDKSKENSSESLLYEEDDIFDETTSSITIVKNEPDVEVNPSFFNKKSDEGYYHCKLCTKKYKTSKSLYDHTLAHHKEVKFYHCDICNFFSLWKSALRRHESLFHAVEDTMTPSSSEIEEHFHFCCHCNYKTKSKKELSDHVLVHFSKTTNYSCSKCERKFFSQKLYERHIKSHENGEMLACEYCGQSYSKRHLKQHLMKRHGVEVEYYLLG